MGGLLKESRAAVTDWVSNQLMPTSGQAEESALGGENMCLKNWKRVVCDSSKMV